ncbi:hypothetical protein Taro_050849 [Colocasia esculenta]|uniref:Uncharacterized protein n=1 Tax=Colocasia esculenta TaxID=4460 RepID=A0A843XFD4_COLES|nr:hypothetical protein [Colocasia esculenta]
MMRSAFLPLFPVALALALGPLVEGGHPTRPGTTRYQRVSPDCLPLSNGRKPGLRTVKEDDHPENGRIPNFSGYDGKGPRVRSAAPLNPSTSQDHHFPQFVLPSPDPSAHHHENHPPAKGLNHHDVNGNSPSRGGDVLLQWGHKKRSRGSRAESRAAGDEPSSAHARQAAKIQRRSSVPGVDKQAAAAMPPPGAGYSRGANLRPCSSARDPMASAINRNGEERSGTLSRSEKRSPPSSLDKAHKTTAACAAAAANGLPPHAGAHDAENNMASTPSSDAGDGAGPAPVAKEKLNLDLFQWPRIYISLSRKEKEDDFLAMKGTKLPQRPKKRAKNVDKTLQYLFPGMWLSDLTRGRYEVREKKSVKKKRRGLKGMESMDSESE